MSTDYSKLQLVNLEETAFILCCTWTVNSVCDTHAGRSSNMSAVVDNGSNSRFFRWPWVGREGLWPGLDTLVSYSCEKSSRSGSDACRQNHRFVRVEHENMEAGGKRVKTKRMGHCVWCLQTQRESLLMWKLGVCSYEEVWRHLNVSNPRAALRNCVKSTSSRRGVFLRTVSLAGAVPVPVPSTAQAQNQLSLLTEQQHKDSSSSVWEASTDVNGQYVNGDLFQRNVGEERNQSEKREQRINWCLSCTV